MNQRRSNIEIIGDMLRVGENGAGKTEIMYSANMSYSQLQKYLKQCFRFRSALVLLPRLARQLLDLALLLPLIPFLRPLELMQPDQSAHDQANTR